MSIPEAGRVWHKRNNQMAKVLFVFFGGEHFAVQSIFSNCDISIDCCPAGSDKIIYMKPTGLFDRDNTPIFELDWIRQWNELFSVETCPGGFHLERWRELKDGRVERIGSSYSITALCQKNCKVIGNMPQNPDLSNVVVK
jgi:hypothetical protein